VPLYDYDCAACGRRFEVIHGVHADPPASCPLCGSGPVRKAIQAPTVHFKGSGWAKKERRAGVRSGTGSGTGDEGSEGKGTDGQRSGGEGSGGEGSGGEGSSSDEVGTGTAVASGEGSREGSGERSSGSTTGSTTKPTSTKSRSASSAKASEPSAD